MILYFLLLLFFFFFIRSPLFFAYTYVGIRHSLFLALREQIASWRASECCWSWQTTGKEGQTLINSSPPLSFLSLFFLVFYLLLALDKGHWAGEVAEDATGRRGRERKRETERERQRERNSIATHKQPWGAANHSAAMWDEVRAASWLSKPMTSGSASFCLRLFLLFLLLFCCCLFYFGLMIKYWQHGLFYWWWWWFNNLYQICISDCIYADIVLGLSQ